MNKRMRKIAEEARDLFLLNYYSSAVNRHTWTPDLKNHTIRCTMCGLDFKNRETYVCNGGLAKR